MTIGFPEGPFVCFSGYSWLLSGCSQVRCLKVDSCHHPAVHKRFPCRLPVAEVLSKRRPGPVWMNCKRGLNCAG